MNSSPENQALLREAVIIASLLISTCVLAATGHHELAATALGGALGMVTPRRVAPMALGLVFGSLVQVV